VIANYRKMAGRKWKGWAVGFCLPTNSRGWLSLSTKVIPIFSPKKLIRIIGVVLYIELTLLILDLTLLVIICSNPEGRRRFFVLYRTLYKF
jgi:hypothetical protein